MQEQSKLLVWNYSAEEKDALDAFLTKVGAPPAESIDRTRAHLTLREIIDGTGATGEAFDSDVQVLLFHAVPSNGVRFLIGAFKEAGLPRPIYAVVTEHSIRWPFKELLEHLVEERNRMDNREG